MFRILNYLISSVFAPVLILTSTANAADPTLVGFWKFEEADGTLFDQSDNHNDGTPFNGVLYQQAGQVGYALGFDGADDYIVVGTTGRPTDTFSFGGWFKTPATHEIDPEGTSGVGGVNNQRYAFDPQHGGDSNAGAGLSLGTNGIVVYEHGSNYMPATAVYEIELGDDWNHIMIVYDDKQPTIYLNGLAVHTGLSSPRAIVNSPIQFGGMAYGYFEGLMDEVRIYNRVLSAAEIRKLAARPKAWSPDPPSGAMYSDTWVTLSWSPGDLAASHDVYLGDNFSDVSDGIGDTFRGNQTLPHFVAGFPGYAYPDGLVNGNTYYWRIDEVNDADPNSPWKGNVWSFWIPPTKAYEPVPSDGGKFIDAENLVLSWTPGFGAALHTVYFGDDFDTVANATDGILQGITNFSPGPLELEKTYFWRVDEFETQGTHIGDVWNFTTAKVGGGVRADYYHWNDPTFVGGGGNPGPGQAFTTFVLTRTDPRIDFSWGDGSPDPAVNVDVFSARWTGEVEAAFTETYTFYTSTDDGVRLWINGQQLVDAWIDQGPTEYNGEIDLVAGNTYSLVMEYYENGGGAVAELRWSSLSTPKQLIPQAALSPPIKASSPSPSNGATGTKMTPILRWGAGDFAASHEVYFGTDANAVANADKASPEYKGPKILGYESYDPGKLAWATSYFWRVDEVNNLNPDSPWIGNLWSFTTGDFLVVDDFEDYNVGDNEIWFAWHDGLGAGAQGSPNFVPSNGTGSMIGDDTTNFYTEESIVHGGNQSMPYWYNNNQQGLNKYSEAELTLTAPRDWTEEGVTRLSLWFRGYPESVGSFVEGPVGTFTMTASGADIWNVNDVEADEFHFAYKLLTGAGSIVARVDSVQNTNDWAKAGVMIRETLDPDSAHAFACVTPANGVASQGRPDTGAASFNTAQGGITAPYWVKLERSISGLFTVSHSANGSNWQPVTGATPQNIPMGSNVYIGLALTAHDAALTCEAVFSNVTTTGTVSQQWAHQDIGIASNDAEPLYVAVSNSAGTPAVVVHDDPAAAQVDTWTEWIIPLQALADQGIVLTNVDRIAIGLGTKGNMTIPGGSGKIFIDDIRLYRPRGAAEE